MGNVLTADTAPAGSPYDRWRLFRGPSRSGPFTLLNEQALTDLTFFDSSGGVDDFYRFSWFDSVGLTESSLSDVAQIIQSYTSVRNVQNLLQITTITDSTNPNIQDGIQLPGPDREKNFIRQGDIFEPTEAELKSFSDRIEEIEEKKK